MAESGFSEEEGGLSVPEPVLRAASRNMLYMAGATSSHLPGFLGLDGFESGHRSCLLVSFGLSFWREEPGSFSSPSMVEPRVLSWAYSSQH